MATTQRPGSLGYGGALLNAPGGSLGVANPGAMTNMPGGSLGVANPGAQTNAPGGALGLSGGGAMTTTMPAPMPPSPVAPYTPPSTPTFTGTAPAPTPYGDFAGLDPATFNRSPESMYLQGEQQKALQRGAAARGTLLTGGAQKRLQENAVGLAGQDFGAAFDRARGVYETNRATNEQNHSQVMDQFTGSIAGFNANTAAGLGYGRLAQDAQAQSFGQARTGALDTHTYEQELSDNNAAQGQAAAAAYAQQVEQQNAAARAAAAAENARPRAPMAVPRTGQPTLGYRPR